jgi:signal transduction histidine kinase
VFVTAELSHRIRVVLWPLGLTLCALAYFAFLDGAKIETSAAAFTTAFLFAFVAAGLIAWARRPGNRLGPLLTAFAFAAIASAFQHSANEIAFTFGYTLVALPLLILGHLALAYPTGRLESRADRLFLTVAYVLIVVTPFARLVVYDVSAQPIGVNECRPAEEACPESVVAFAPSADAFGVMNAVTVSVFIALAVGIVVLLLRRYIRATTRRRRMLAPLVVATLVLFVAIVLIQLSQLRHQSDLALLVGFIIGGVAQVAFVASLLTGMLRTRLGAAAVGDLLVEIERTPTQRIRDALARVLGDSSLELRLWLSERGTYVDPEGRAVPPVDKIPSGRAVTTIARDGLPLALLIHDAGLQDDPELVEAVSAAARLTLENAQLQAELRARLREVEESRARIVHAGDIERRRVERNIHDGAQQRLVALALSLRVAQHSFPPDQATAKIFERTIDELRLAVEELRELARGLHPSLLAEEGLSVALEVLAERTPLQVEVDVRMDGGRLAPELELSSYFVACEAVANAVKHARASRIDIVAGQENGQFAIEVRDNGTGGADPNGSGLRGLADRVAAQGGALLVVSPPAGGTTVRVELPFALHEPIS